MTGSIIAEWNAWEVTSTRAAIPAAARSASSAAMRSLGPEATHNPGAFSAAITTPSGSHGQELVGRQPHRQHAAAGQRLHASPALDDEAERVGERHHAGERGAHPLTDAVTNQR